MSQGLSQDGFGLANSNRGGASQLASQTQNAFREKLFLSKKEKTISLNSEFNILRVIREDGLSKVCSVRYESLV
jgi:hypothetical protein